MTEVECYPWLTDYCKIDDYLVLLLFNTYTGLLPAATTFNFLTAFYGYFMLIFGFADYIKFASTVTLSLETSLHYSLSSSYNS